MSKLTKQLKAEWDKNLKESGFEDIERPDGSLETWSQTFQLKHSPEQAQAKQEYYLMATRFLDEYRFRNKLHEAIWAYHAEGISVRNIQLTLEQVKINMNKDSIHNVISKLKKKMLSLYLYKGRDE